MLKNQIDTYDYNNSGNHKRRFLKMLTTVGLCLALLTVPLTSCKVHVNDSKAARTVSSDLNDKLSAYRTDILDSSKAMSSDRGIRKYLLRWADDRGVNYTVDENGNVIMTVDAGSGYENSDPTVLICPYDSSQLSNCVDPMAMALYAVKNNNDTGKLIVIFTKENNGEYVGAKSLSKGLFSDDSKVIVLDGSEDSLFALSSAYGVSFRFTQNVQYTNPENNVAYKITMKGLGTTEDQSSNKNPILRLCSLLRSLKSSNINYELASFDSGKGGILSADSASMTIVISQDREDRFIQKMDSATTRFNEDKAKLHEGAVYSYEKVKMPESVLTQDSAENFVNFMKTLPHGTFYRDPNTNDVVARTSINSVKIKDEELTINAVGFSLDQAQIKEIIHTEKAFCELSDVKYEKTGSIPNWIETKNTDGTELSQEIARCYKNYSGKTLSYAQPLATSAAGYIKALNPKCEIITMTVNQSVLKNCTGTLIEYLILNLPENSKN
ncbi:MAG: hypothetical protein PUC44_04635 [Eubacteriales bacterium]|nr:hypothetical protein [Eubacteriales bacterium]